VINVIFVGFANACNYPCHDPSACAKLRCDPPGCVKRCRNSCCICQCLENEKAQINM